MRDTTVVAPLSGIVTQKLVDAGEVVTRGTPLVVITDLDHAWANLFVPEPMVPRTVLVVEDEAEVRNIVRRQVESLGHRVLVAEADAEALLLLQAPGAPDVLLTDVVLGSGKNGIDLAEAARRLRPDLPVIFMSGYTAVPDALQRMRDTGAPLLSKPFTTPQLARAVNAVSVAG